MALEAARPHPATNAFGTSSTCRNRWVELEDPRPVRAIECAVSGWESRWHACCSRGVRRKTEVESRAAIRTLCDTTRTAGKMPMTTPTSCSSGPEGPGLVGFGGQYTKEFSDRTKGDRTNRSRTSRCAAGRMSATRLGGAKSAVWVETAGPLRGLARSGPAGGLERALGVVLRRNRKSPALPMFGDARVGGCGRQRADIPEGRRWQACELPASPPYLDRAAKPPAAVSAR